VDNNLILSIDTSTALGGIALLNGTGLFSCLTINLKRIKTETILVHIDYLLSINSLTPQDIDCIAVCKGPGSFTGIRVGLSTAKGLSMGLNNPIIGVSSLYAIAYRADLLGRIIVPIINARRGQVFAAAYQPDLSLSIPHGAYKLGDFLNMLDEDAVFTGSGIIQFMEEIKRVFRHKAFFLDNKSIAENIALIALERLVKGDVDDFLTLCPEYLRDADAVIPKEQKRV
jgi:tRNA threonylcarbamoyladenosine biosynthesis protein TsaB